LHPGSPTVTQTLASIVACESSRLLRGRSIDHGVHTDILLHNPLRIVKDTFRCPWHFPSPYDFPVPSFTAAALKPCSRSSTASVLACPNVSRAGPTLASGSRANRVTQVRPSVTLLKPIRKRCRVRPGLWGKKVDSDPRAIISDVSRSATVAGKCHGLAL
jgi:hypothetical protein